MVGAGDASPWVIGTDNYLYHYSNDYAPPRIWPKDWGSASTSSVAVSPEGTPWKIDSLGNVAKRTGPNTWSSIGGLLAYEVGVGGLVGGNDNAWAIARTGCLTNGDCPIYQFNGAGWFQQPGAARHVAVAPDGTTYVSNHAGTLFKWTGTAWTAWGSRCVRNLSNGDHLGWPVIAAAPNDNVWIIGCTGTGADFDVYDWLPHINAWEQIPNAAGTSISVSSDGTPWLINSATNIFEYVSTWQPMGPSGFSFVDQTRGDVSQIWTGEVHDIDATPASGVATIAATSGGVWQNAFGWVPISDVGAGVGSDGSFSSGPVNSTGTLTVKPSDQNTVVVATGVAGFLNGPNSNGNGIWVTHNANAIPVSWSLADIYDQSNSKVQPGTAAYPTTFAKVRYSADGTKIYALSTQAPLAAPTTQALYLSLDDGVSFHQAADSLCGPSGPDVFTDLVVDPNNSSIAYFGVAAEGVWQATWTGPAAKDITCSHGVPPVLFNGDSSSITAVALAISATSNPLLYAAFAGLPDGFGNDFENLDAITTATWNQGWTAVLRPDSPLLVCNYPCISQWGLNSQNSCDPVKNGCGHNWALGTDPTGTVVLLGGGALYRGTSCGLNGCVSFDQISPDGGPYQPGHTDYHSIAWASNGWVYVANDGGLFYSTDSGATWNAQANSFGVSNETSVDVFGTSIYGTAWDVGAHYSQDDGTSWTSFHGLNGNDLGLDTRQAVANQTFPAWAFICATGNRESFDGTTWTEIDHSSAPVEKGNCMMAFGNTGPLFTTGNSNPDIYYTNTFNDPNSWVQYQTDLPAIPWSVYASNESPPSVYAITNLDQLNVSITGGSWLSPITPPWPAGYQFAGNGSAPGAALATGRANNDLYVVGVTSGLVGARVFQSSYHGQRWRPLTGTVPASLGVPGMLKQDEVVKNVYPDPSLRGVIVGSNGTALASAVYGAATIWRLNNFDVADSNHHWRPWVNGLPVGTQPVNWITGKYGSSDGIFYYYIATWGRGIWKREARGGDF